MDQLDLFILRGLRGFFEVQLTADRNAEDKIALLFAPGDEQGYLVLKICSGGSPMPSAA